MSNDTAVFGIFPDQPCGEKAKAELEAAGFQIAGISPVTEETVKHLPLSTDVMSKRVAASAVGMVAIGTLGMAAGSVLGPLGALGGAAVAGGAGAVASMALADRAPAAFRHLIGVGVVVTVHCPEPQAERVLSIMRSSGAVELSETVDQAIHE
ncbi:MAG: hypothetical protein SFV51_01205 [Bryobacteraceae bacterium]|nr:hypothetical protein [Bryobacteraceae bacterium]